MPEVRGGQRQAEGGRGVAQVGHRPQQVARRRRSGRRPHTVRLPDRAPVALAPEPLAGHAGAAGPAAAHRDLGAGAVDAPVVVDPQADRREAMAIGVALAGGLGQQLAEPVLVLRGIRVLLVDRQVARDDVMGLEGEAGGGGGGGEHHALDPAGDGRLQHVDRADDVEREQLRRGRSAGSGDRRQMDDGVLIGAGAAQLVGVHEIAADPGVPGFRRRRAAEAGQPVCRGQRTAQVAADDAAAAGHEHAHAVA